MTYHPSGQIATLVTKNATTGDQVTRYVYGSAKAWQTPLIYRNDMLAAEIYPDSDDSENVSGVLQAGTDGVVDRVEFLYNRIGERIAKRDQNGTVHTYEYDNLGRLLHDRITTLASGIDGAVRRISTVYDVAGNVKSVTSFDGSNNVVNQVMYEYDANGLLSKDFSNPSGAVIASTPYIGYAYDTAKSGEFFTRRLRQTTMKYPSGKTLTYDYGVSGSADDLFNRYSGISDGAQALVQYAFNGAATPMKTTYSQPGLALDYTASGALDRFGRITDHAWKKSSTDVVRIQHAYDRAGNRISRTDAVNAASSEVYTYDGVNQIKSLNRGSSAFTESWNYDGTGNWLSYNRSGTVENRTHNKANEVQSTCTHDRNGNMTVMPGLRGVYDAWNRLVETRNASNVLLATYGYNGLNHRVKKTVGGVVTTSVFNQQWQELETLLGANEPRTLESVNIWGNRYIDDLVLREKGAERLYSIADPNWNVVAITNASGTVQERMRYDAFGKVTWLDAAFATKASSGFSWDRTFTGQVLDSETGLMLYRNRFYHTGLGRFVQRDPIGYDAEDVNVYRCVANSICNSTDVDGMQIRQQRRYTCSEALAQALKNLPRPRSYDELFGCNVDIQCSDNCARSSSGQQLGNAMCWDGDTHIHICFREDWVINLREFTALLIHELTHAQQILDGRTQAEKDQGKLCPKDRCKDKQRSPTFDERKHARLPREEQMQMYADCLKNEDKPCRNQLEYLRASGNALVRLIANCKESSCMHLKPR